MNSVDLKARTATVVASTFADVDRGGYIERMGRNIDPASLAGLPVLDSHKRTGLSDVLGRVKRSWLDGENLMAEIELSERAEAILKDMAAGIIRGVSLGFGVSKWRETREAGRLIREAVEWTARELSLVPVAADPGATVRQELPMDDQETTERTDEPAATTENRADINPQIRRACNAAGLDRNFADDLVDRGATVEEARTAIYDELVKRGGREIRTVTPAGGHNDQSLDNPEVFRAAVGEALFARTETGHELSHQARSFTGISIPEVARECLRHAGVTTLTREPADLVTRAMHTTSDFPEILGNSINRTMRARLATATRSAITLARRTTSRDFRAKIKLQLSTGPEPLPVGEHGKYQSGTYTEAKESYAAKRYGRMIGFTVEVLANDDLGAFSDVSGDFAQSWAEFEDQQIVTLIEANPTMGDGTAVFHADHGNLAAAGAAPSETTLSDGRLAMRRQKEIGGRLVNIAPRTVLVPPELETSVEKLLSSIQAHTVADVNPFASLKMVVEPRLSDPAAWYLVADPGLGVGIEYAQVEGLAGPRVTSMRDFDTSGLKVKVEGTFGAAFIDHRGWYRNAGA